MRASRKMLSVAGVLAATLATCILAVGPTNSGIGNGLLHIGVLDNNIMAPSTDIRNGGAGEIGRSRDTFCAGAVGASIDEQIIPDGTCSGVPMGTNLTVYDGPTTITTDGTVIDGKIINGTLRVTAHNVIVKNSYIAYTGWWGIDADIATNITIEDCTFVGPGYTGDSNAALAGSGYFLRNDISKSENGIVLTVGTSVVEGNYIHDLQDGYSDPHYDGISVQGGQNGVRIENNTVIGRDTSDVFIKNDFGSISDVTVDHNYLGGNPAYNIYVDGRADGGPITGVAITNNYLEKGVYGYYSVDNSTPVISGNVELRPSHSTFVAQ